MTAARLPLSALLSQAFVAFTIECDNEFEHRMPHRTTRFGASAGTSNPRAAPWLISMAMWAHCLRHVPQDGIPAADFAGRAGLSRRTAEMVLKRMGRWWGYLEIAPGPGQDRASAARSDWVVRPTPAGRRAREIWEPLPDLITARWRERFGATVGELRSALAALAGELDPSLPEFMPITSLGGDWRVRSGPVRARSEDPGFAASLPALLSRSLVAFALELERATGLSPVLGANVVRVLDDTGVPARRLSALTGLADMGIENSLSALRRRGYVTVETGRVARLTPEGVDARGAYDAAVGEVEGKWGRAAVRGPLEELLGCGVTPDSPLLAGLTPYPDGWRAQVPPPQTLPHYPFVSHRGGYPDGS